MRHERLHIRPMDALAVVLELGYIKFNRLSSDTREEFREYLNKRCVELEHDNEYIVRETNKLNRLIALADIPAKPAK